MGNLNGGGVQTGINGSQTTTSSTTTSSTTTTSTTSSNQSGQISTNTNNLNTNNQTATSLNTNSKNCNSYINNIDEVVKTIQNETFDADKRSYIENDLKMYCVSADQSYRIVKALTFDSDRIDMCIFLYDRMIDKANGKRLLELLTFDSDKETFNAYMKAH